MLRNWTTLLAMVGLALSLTAEASTLSVAIVDSQTGQPVEGARIIVNHGTDAEPSEFEMVQKNRQFQPKSLVVATGSDVNFPNRDTTQHHVYSFSPAKVFNIELFADQPEAPIQFDKTGVVEIGCNIHDQMQGFILVTDSALTAQTDTAGMALVELPESTTGLTELGVSVWHPRLTNTTRTVDFVIDFAASDSTKLSVELAPERREAGRLDGLQQRFRDL